MTEKDTESIWDNLPVNPVGHAAVCEWDEAHPETGLRWEDMWGNDSDFKKMNFFLYRRGLLERKIPYGARSARGGNRYVSSRRWAMAGVG